MMSATLKKEFRPGQPKWRPGRLKQNMTNLEETKVSKYVKSKTSQETPEAIKSQMAWQLRQRNLPRNRLMSIEELEKMGYQLPNFENMRERLTKDMVMEEGEEDFVESLEQSADEPTPEHEAKKAKRQDVKSPRSTDHPIWSRKGELDQERVMQTIHNEWLSEEAIAPVPAPIMHLTEEQAAMAKAHWAAISPPAIIRMVKRPDWNADSPIVWDRYHVYDPLRLTKEQWEHIQTEAVPGHNEKMYAPAIDRRWPGFMTQPWFISEGEVEKAFQEERISRDYARQCKKGLKMYGNCLNQTRKKMYGLEEFRAMMQSRTGDVGESSTPDSPSTAIERDTDASPVDLDTADKVTDEDSIHPDTA